MKVSGAHIEEISAWTNMGYESAEKIRIQSTVEKLAKEGKHVINIIHGNKTMVGGDYAKTITFLWEADDEDSRYKEFVEKQKKIEAMENEISNRKNDILSLKKKIQKAEDFNPNYSVEERIKDAKKSESLFPWLAVIFGSIGVIFFVVMMIIFNNEDMGFFSLFMLIMAVACGGGVAINFSELKDRFASKGAYKNIIDNYAESTVRTHYESQMKDKTNLTSLRSELKTKEKSLATLEKEVENLKRM